MAQQQIDDFEPDDFEPETNEPGLLESFAQNYPGATGFLRRIFLGPNREEVFPQEHLAKYPNAQLIGPPSEHSLLPRIPNENTEGWGDYILRGMYNQIVRPLGSAEGLIGSVTSFGPNPAQVLPKRTPLALPPAPPKPSFISGPAGTAINVPYEVSDDIVKNILPPDTVARGETGFGISVPPRGTIANLDELAEANRQSQLTFGPEAQYPGTRLTLPDKELPIPPVSGDTRLGFSEQTQADLPYPLNIVPDVIRPRSAQTNIASQSGMRALDRVIPESAIDDFIPDIGFISGAPEVTQLDEPLTYKAILDNATNQPPNPSAQTSTARQTTKAALEAPKAPIDDKPIISTLDPKDAILNWTRGLESAKWRGVLASDNFKDLTDPSLIDKYQKGFRQGKLIQLQKAFDDLFEAEKQLGLIDDAKYRENYLRQYWDYDKSSAEAIKIFESRVIPKNASFAKDRTFETYAQGIEAGLVPKYQTIPEIYGARVAESYKAMKHKELYDYLLSHNWIKPTQAIHTPNAWEITGPHRNQIQKLVKNYLSPNEGFTSTLGNVGSRLKNIYLSGGIPGTKFNMHLWNTARADIKLMGFGKGLTEALTDPTGNKALKWFNETDKSLLPELIEHGYQFSPVEDYILKDAPTGTLFNKGERIVGKLFEAPLFHRALPALKFKRAQQVYNKLEPKIGKDAALDAAAKISNQFFGGMEKSLRDKTAQNLARFAVIAPDWAEAKIMQALSEWKSTGKVLMGQGDAVDKMLAKAFGRGVLFPIVGAGTTAAFGHEIMGDTPRFQAPISLGESAVFPTLTTADEAVRLPIATGNELLQGNPFSALQIAGGNRMNPAMEIPLNLLRNRNYWGGRIYSGDNTLGENIQNVAGEVTKPIPIGAKAIFDMMMGNISPAEAAAQGLEWPIAFRK